MDIQLHWLSRLVRVVLIPQTCTILPNLKVSEELVQIVFSLHLVLVTLHEQFTISIEPDK